MKFLIASLITLSFSIHAQTEGYGKPILTCETEERAGTQYIVTVYEAENESYNANLIRRDEVAKGVYGSTGVFQQEPVSGGADLEFLGDRPTYGASCGFIVQLPNTENGVLSLSVSGINPGYPHRASTLSFRSEAFGISNTQTKSVDCGKQTTITQFKALQQKCMHREAQYHDGEVSLSEVFGEQR